MEILDRRSVILGQGVKGIKLLDKAMWAFMMRDHGTSEFFYDIVTMIQKFDRENMVYPKQLATFCNYLSKLSNNVGGGFGLYKTAENKLMMYLPKMDFHELCQIAYIVVSQQIGSDKLTNTISEMVMDRMTKYDKLEESILNKKISVDPRNLRTFDLKITVGDLVRLLKAFSLHKFRGTPLVERLLAKLEIYLPGLSNHQIESVLWSLTKAGFANKDLYSGLEKEFGKRIKTLSFRALSFSFSEFVDYGQISPKLYAIYLNEIERRLLSIQDNEAGTEDPAEDEEMKDVPNQKQSKDSSIERDETTTGPDSSTLSPVYSAHYYLLLLKGIVHSAYIFYHDLSEDNRKYINDTQKSILGCIFTRLENNINDSLQFKTRDVMKITDLIREGMASLASDPRVRAIFEKLEPIFILNYKQVDKSGVIGLESPEDDYTFDASNEPVFSFDDLCRIYVNYTLCGVGSKHFMDFLSAEINSKVIKITKRSFSSTFFSLVANGRCENPNLFYAIIFELHKYGDYKYFFTHKDFVKMTWALLTTHFKDRFKVCEEPVPKAFAVMSPNFLDTPWSAAKDDEEIFQQNFEIMKMIAKITKKSTLEIFETLMEINLNTVDTLTQRLILQCLLMVNFLLKGEKKQEIIEYMSQLSPQSQSALIIASNPYPDPSADYLSQLDRIFTEVFPGKQLTHNVVCPITLQNITMLVGDPDSPELAITLLTPLHMASTGEEVIRGIEENGLLLLAYTGGWNLLVIRDGLGEAEIRRAALAAKEIVAGIEKERERARRSQEGKQEVQGGKRPRGRPKKTISEEEGEKDASQTKKFFKPRTRANREKDSKKEEVRNDDLEQ